MTLEQAGAIKNTEIAKELCLPPVKLHCSSSSCPLCLPASTCLLLLIPDPTVLAEDAIKAAIKDYQNKRAAKILASTLPVPPTGQATAGAQA